MSIMDFLTRWWKVVMGVCLVVAVVSVGVIVWLVTRPAVDGFVGVGDPEVDSVDPVKQDAQNAAIAVVTSMLSYSPAMGETPDDRLRVEKDRLSGQLRDAAESNHEPVRTKKWYQWQQAGDRIMVFVTIRGDSDIPEDAVSVVIPVTARTVVRHKNGDETPIHTNDIDAHLVKEAGVWKVASLDYLNSK